MKQIKFIQKPIKFSFCIGAIRVAWNVQVPSMVSQGE